MEEVKQLSGVAELHHTGIGWNPFVVGLAIRPPGL